MMHYNLNMFLQNIDKLIDVVKSKIVLKKQTLYNRKFDTSITAPIQSLKLN